MSSFPMIGKLGLSITEWGDGDKTSVVLAHELESLLQSAQVVYGYPKDPFFTGWKSMDNYPYKNPSHQALLICVEPIKKKTKAEAALEFMQMFVEQKTTWHSQQAWKEAKRILEMKDEV